MVCPRGIDGLPCPGGTSLIAAFRDLAASWGGLWSDLRYPLGRSSGSASVLLSLCSSSATLQGGAQHSFHSRSRGRPSSRVRLKPLTRTHAAGKVWPGPRWPEIAGGILARPAAILRWRPAVESSPRGKEPAIVAGREAGYVGEGCTACRPKSHPTRSMGRSTNEAPPQTDEM